MVRLTCIVATAVATAIADAKIRWSVSNRKQLTPIKADKKCPPKRFRGWAKGLEGAENNNTAEAPKDPTTKR